MDYIFTITETDEDNVDSSFAALHGRLEHWFNLTQKTYTTYRIADNVPTVTTVLVWEENIAKIYYYKNLEINRLERQLLLEKTRMHEINYFKAYMRIGADETNATIEAQMAQTNADLTYLKNYNPNL